ncbi:WSC and DUF1996 domain containing protein [Pseudohyphozyma bogoriensis]|nr:WSC and DUF1996 domain containing protein [Pseudohyphozyma bogoriensis]
MAGNGTKFVDAKELLLNALPHLGDGEMIKSDKLSLLEIMSAIEILDPRTDMYCAETPKDENAVPFDPSLDLLPEELIWVLDELLRLEMTHVDGHPLVSTLFTTPYLRSDALAAVARPTPPSKRDPTKPEGLRKVVLRGMLLGVIKTAELVWDELCKMNVYDNEDVQLAISSISFNGLQAAAFPPSPLLVNPSADQQEERIVTVDDILAALDEAVQWVNENLEGSPYKDAIIGRLAIRMDLVILTALLSSPTFTTPTQLDHHLSRISAFLNSPGLAPSTHEPSRMLKAAFEKNAGSRLPSLQPIRDIPAVDSGVACGRFKSWTVQIGMAVQAWKRWEVEGWKGVDDFATTWGRTRSPIYPYARSVYQSLLFSSAQIFVTSPSIKLTSTFFSSLTSLPSELWDRLSEVRMTETSWNSPARRSLGSRARRRMVKGRKMVSQIIDEAPEFIPLLASIVGPLPSLPQLPIALSTVLLSQLLEALLSGFELELYEQNEWGEVWWVAQRVAAALVKLFERLEGRDWVVEARTREWAAVRELAGASFLRTVLHPTPMKKTTSPFLPPDLAISENSSHSDHPDIKALEDNLDRARFERRFHWLVMPERPELDGVASWIEYHREVAQLQAAEVSTLREQVERRYSAAMGNVETWQLLATVNGTTVQKSKWMLEMKKICLGNLAVLGEGDSADVNYFQWKNGSFTKVDQVGGGLIYYLPRNHSTDTTPVMAFPDGLRMLIGNPMLRTYNASSPMAQAIGWNCLGQASNPTRNPFLPPNDCPNGLRGELRFPSCWDGKNIDSSDHISHMSYGGGESGPCPATHPVRIVTLFYDDPTGYFLDGWDKPTLQNAINTCTSDSGVIEYCKVFDLYDSGHTCAKTPSVNEIITGTLATLPGCNPVTYTQTAMCTAPTTPSLFTSPVGYEGGAPPPGAQVLSNAPRVLESYKTWTYKSCYSDADTTRALPHGLSNPAATANGCLDACAAANYTMCGIEYHGECWGANTLLANTNCMLDLVNSARSLPQTLSANSTVDSCLAACDKAGLAVCGLSYYGECYGGPAISRNAAVQPASKCTYACKNNAKETCGGSGTLDVYTSTVVAPLTAPAAPNLVTANWTYSACQSDLVNNVRSLPLGLSSNSTVEGCLAACTAKKAVACGLSYFGECWASTTGLSSASKVLDATKYNPLEWCGGSAALSVYLPTVKERERAVRSVVAL